MFSLGGLFPSKTELMSIKSKENVEELRIRYLPGYRDSTMGEDHYLTPTERSKIAVNMAMKIMGERVAIHATLQKSFDKDNFIVGLIDQVKWLQQCAKQNHTKGCTWKQKNPKK